MSTKAIFWPDIFYYAEGVLHEESRASVQFTVWKATGDEDGKPSFEKKDATPPCDTQNPVEAEPYVTGYVKWDGCSNFNFGPEERGMTHYFHFCSQKEAGDFGEMLKRLYLLTAELIPENRENILG